MFFFFAGVPTSRQNNLLLHLAQLSKVMVFLKFMSLSQTSHKFLPNIPELPALVLLQMKASSQLGWGLVIGGAIHCEGLPTVLFSLQVTFTWFWAVLWIVVILENLLFISVWTLSWRHCVVIQDWICFPPKASLKHNSIGLK